MPTSQQTLPLQTLQHPSPITHTVAHQSMTKDLDHSDWDKHHQQSAQLTSRQHRRPQFHHQIPTIRATIEQKVNHRPHSPHAFQLPRRRQSRTWTRRPRSPRERDLYLSKRTNSRPLNKKHASLQRIYVYECAAPDRREKVDKFHHLVGFGAERHDIEVLPLWTPLQQSNGEVAGSRRGMCLCLLRRGRRLMMSAWELPSKWGGEE